MTVPKSVSTIMAGVAWEKETLVLWVKATTRMVGPGIGESTVTIYPILSAWKV
jgi:hypothetical protein